MSTNVIKNYVKFLSFCMWVLARDNKAEFLFHMDIGNLIVVWKYYPFIYSCPYLDTFSYTELEFLLRIFNNF
jgi:hypothetical protein